jgi:hypothetical protein
MSARGGWRRPTSAHPDRPDTWPIVWRVVAPAAGSYNHDMVFCESEDEAEARRTYRSLRAGGGWTVRLERVSCGPLPEGAKVSLADARASNPQNPGVKMRPVLGHWEQP